ncbi:MAG: SAM-dependent methyltransferase [Clostridia bacterium]|nr:SAM-dependent methyltransferase [Clostridia bacterium]
MTSSEKYREMVALITAAATGGALTRLVLSRKTGDAAEKTVGRLCRFRGESVLALEASFPDGKVKHSRLTLPPDEAALDALLAPYAQVNLLTAAGNAEYRRAASGKETLLAPRGLAAKLDTVGVALPLPELDRKKNRLLSGDEPFLRLLEVSDAAGRIHDKKQPKFRQINRFLEHLEEVIPALPKTGVITVYDLCCGKSYLSFAVYHHLVNRLHREVDMLCLDLKQDVIDFCADAAARLGFTGMRFLCDDVRRTPEGRPDLVISLHACDIATDLVLETACRLGAEVILSTPCCHRTLGRHLSCAPLSFVSREPQLRQKLAEALTDGLRTLRLSAAGYRVTALELTDPENTPKNTLLRAIREHGPQAERHAAAAQQEYEAALTYLLGDQREAYLNAGR